MTFGKKLYLLRKKKGYSQDKFAEKMGVSRQAVSKWERGESVPDIYVLKQIADLFGVSVDYLISTEHAQSSCMRRDNDWLYRKVSMISLLGVLAFSSLLFDDFL